MSGFGALMRGLLKEGFLTLVIDGLKWLAAIGLPILGGIVTAIAGVLQGLPIAYIIAATAIVFAMIPTGLLRFDEWRTRITPQNKLVLQQAMFGMDFQRDLSTGMATHITTAQAILFLYNSASFPIEFTMDEISSSMEGRINQNPILDNRGSVLHPTSQVLFGDARIEMGNFEVKSVIDGIISFKLSYGRKGNKKYKLEKHLKIMYPQDAATGSYPIGSVQEVQK
jgi:hypothetical protein